MDIRSWLGRDGIRIPESGLAVRSFHSISALESVGGAVLDGDGAIGDLTGITITQGLAAAGTTPGAERFITGTTTTEVEACVAEFTTVRVQRPGLSRGTARLLEDTRNPAVRAASAQVPSAATSMADRPGAFRHAEVPASVEAEGRVAAEAGAGNRSRVTFRANREI